MADDLNEEWDAAVQKVVDEVFEIFKLLACRPWITWGSDLLFTELREEVAREEAKEEALRAQEVEEGVREAAAAAKAARIEDR